MPKDESNLLVRWFEEVWNKGRMEAIDELATPDATCHCLTDAEGNKIQGCERFKLFWREFRATFPDIRVEVEDSLMDGDRAVVRATVRGTHRGAGFGFAATHKPIVFSGMCMARIENGRIAEAWDHWDFLSVHQQLSAGS